ncbi:MAG: carboxypeptidase-like regulatory domain-containing protein, partial [Kosmotogaceae bacterium]
MKKGMLVILVILLSVISLSSYRILDTPGTSALHNTPSDQHYEYYFKDLGDSILYIYDTWDGDGNFALLRYGKNGEIFTPYKIHRSEAYSEECFDIEISEDYIYVLKETNKGLFKIERFSLDGVPMDEYIYESEDDFAYKSDYSPFRKIDIDVANIVLSDGDFLVDFVSVNSMGRGKYELAIFRYVINPDMELLSRKLLGYDNFDYKPRVITFGSETSNFFFWEHNNGSRQVTLYSSDKELGLKEQFSFNYDMNFSTKRSLFQFKKQDDYSLIVYPTIYTHLEDTFFIPSILLIKDNEIEKTLTFSDDIDTTLAGYEDIDLNRMNDRFWGRLFISETENEILLTSDLINEFYFIKKNYDDNWNTESTNFTQLTDFFSQDVLDSDTLNVYKDCPFILFNDNQGLDSYLFFGNDGYYYDHHSSFLYFSRNIDWSQPDASIYDLTLSSYNPIEVPYNGNTPKIDFAGKITNFGQATITGLALTNENPQLASISLNDLEQNILSPGETVEFSGSFFPESIWAKDSKVRFCINATNDSFNLNNETSAVFPVKEIPESMFVYIPLYDYSWEEYSSLMKPYPLLEDDITILGDDYFDKTKAGFFLGEGNYSFLIHPQNYDSTTVSFNIIRKEDDPYILYEEGMAKSYYVKSCGDISFHVATAEGTPIKNAEIDISSVADGRTNSEGNKTFEDVKNGEQLITVNARHFKTSYIEVNIPYNGQITKNIILEPVPKGIATIHVETDSWPVSLQIYDDDVYYYAEDVNNPVVNVELFDDSYHVRALKGEEETTKSLRVYGGENTNVTVDVKETVPYSERSKRLRSKSSLIIPAALHGYTPPPGEQFDVSIMIGLFELEVELYGKENDDNQISEIDRIDVTLKSGPQFVDSVSAMWTPVSLEDIGGLYSPSGVPDWVGSQGEQVGKAFDAIPFVKMPEIELKASYGSGLTKVVLRAIKVVS